MANPNQNFAQYGKFVQGLKGSTPSGSGNAATAANLVAAIAAARKNTQPPTETDWDKFWRPAGALLNAIGAGGYGVENAVNESINAGGRAATGKGTPADLRYLTPITGFVPDAIKGLIDGLTNNEKDLVTGSKLIENATDVIGGATTLGYKNEADNVNPWVKGIGGFALDVGLDPLTYVPGGAVLSGLKGGIKGGIKAAKDADTGKNFAMVKNLLTPAKTGGAGLLSRAPVSQGAYEGIKAWSADRAASKAVKASIKDAKARMAKGEATVEDIGVVVNHEPLRPPKKGEKVPPTVITDALGEGKTAIDNLIESVSTPPAEAPSLVSAVQKGEGDALAAAQKKAIDNEANLSELSIRQRAAERLAPSLAAAQKIMPLSIDDALAAARRITGEKPAYNKRTRDLIENIGTPPIVNPKLLKTQAQKNAAMTAQNAWLARVTKLIGDDGTAARNLRTVATKAPDSFKDVVASLASKKVVQSYDKENISTIFERVKAQKTYNPEDQLQAFAKSIGLDKRSWTKEVGSWKEFFTTSNKAKTILDATLIQERANTSLFRMQAVPDGDVIEHLSKGMTAPEAMSHTTQDFADYVSTLSDEELVAYTAAWHATASPAMLLDDAKMWSKSGKPLHSFVDRTGDTGASNFKYEKGAERAPWQRSIKANVWEQHKTLSYMKEALKAVRQLSGQKGALAEDAMLLGIRNAARFHDLRLRSLGVSPVSMKLKGEDLLFRSAGKDAEGIRFRPNSTEVAYLGISDVLDAVPDNILKALFVAGKDISLPPTILHDIGRLVLKAAGSDMGAGEQLAVVVTHINQIAEHLPDMASKAFMHSEQGRQATIALAGSLLTPEVVSKLAEANIRNGAFARTISGARSHEMTDAIRATLMTELRLPDGTVGSDADGILASIAQLRSQIAKAGAEGTEDAVAAEYDVEQTIARTADLGQHKNSANAIHMVNQTKVDSTGAPLRADTAKRIEDEALSGVGGIGADGRPTKTTTKPKTATTLRAEKKAAEQANTARVAELVQLQPEIAELTRKMADALASGATDDLADLDVIHSAITFGLPGWLKMVYRFGTTMSGSFGMGDLKPFSSAADMSIRHQIADFRGDIGQLEKVHSKEDLAASWNVFRNMKDNAGLEKALEGVSDSTAAASRALWPAFKLVFDHSDHNLFARSGMDGDYINGYLAKMGVGEAHRLPAATGWAIGKAWKKFDFGPEDDPMELLKQYQAAMQQASVAPGIAASFAYSFGHKSNQFGAAMTDAEAIARKWKKIDPNGRVTDKGIVRSIPLSQFLDPTQYYDPKMLEQLATMEAYLGKSKILDGEGFFDKAFRHIDPIVNAIKSSITIWRPGHHVTNIAGEALFNTLAGVWNPARYADAARIMASHGLAEGSIAEGIAKHLEQNAPEGFTVKASDTGKGILMTIGGKTQFASYDSIFKLLDRAGVILHHQQAEDFLTEGADLLAKGRQSPFAVLSKLPGNATLGKVSASRDNVFRIAHAVDILNKRGFRSLDEAMRLVAKEVHSFHPTMQTLSAVEQKYVRRWIYFYTWQRQALSRVVESMIETPARVMIAPKAIYNEGVIAGTDPQSFGQPMPNDPRIPKYSQGNITSILWNGPEQGLGQPGGGDAAFLWGATINAPQLDILQQIFGTIATNPDKSIPEQFVEGAGQFAANSILANVNPIIKTPIELATQHHLGSGTQIKNVGEYLLDQTGLGYPSRGGLFGVRSDTSTNPVEQQAKLDRTLVNWFSGAKVTDFTTPAAATRANADRAAELARLLKTQQP